MAGLALTAITVACGPPPPVPTVPTNPLSLGSGGTVGNGPVVAASLSDDGRWVAFTSGASDLVPGDTNGVADLFLRDQQSGTVNRIVANPTGEPRMSANGRFVSFVVAGQIGVHDRIAATSTVWSPSFSAIGGPTTPVISPDGATAVYGAYSSFGITAPACRVRVLATGAETDCPHGGPGFGTVAYEAASASGRHVLYYWNDQDGGGTSGRRLWDRTAGTFVAIPTGVATFPGLTALSEDGHHLAYAAFQPAAALLPTVYDAVTGSSVPLPGPAPDGTTAPVDISSDGTVVLLLSEATNLVPGDTNGKPDLFRWDVTGGTVTRISTVIGTGAELPSGAGRCGTSPGQLLATGTAGCGTTVDAAVVTDGNATTDAYRFG